MRTRHARQTLEALRERFGDKLFRTVIRQSIVYAESAERAIPILDYRPEKGADYLSLAGEILRRLGKQEMLERLDELSAEVVPALRDRPNARGPGAQRDVVDPLVGGTAGERVRSRVDLEDLLGVEPVAELGATFVVDDRNRR